MRYWLDRPWPVAQFILPRAIVVDESSNDQWSIVARGRVPPPDAIPLDDEALAVMKKHYWQHPVFMGWG